MPWLLPPNESSSSFRPPKAQDRQKRRPGGTQCQRIPASRRAQFSRERRREADGGLAGTHSASRQGIHVDDRRDVGIYRQVESRHRQTAGGKETRMSLSERIWDTFTTVIQLRDKIGALTEAIKTQQIQIQDLTAGSSAWKPPWNWGWRRRQARPLPLGKG